MKKFFFPVSLACLLATFTLLPVVKAGNTKAMAAATLVNEPVAEAPVEVSAVAAASVLYDSLQLNKMGLTKEAMLHAYKGYAKIQQTGRASSENILTVIDFSQRSDKKRMYIIDVKNFKVLINTYVAHGKNTGLQYAEKFSNTPESLQSSLGFYVTKGTYFGKHGLSLKLEGLERGFNDKAEARAVVVHGAAYIGAHRLGAPYMGRSFGCPAVPQEVSAEVINLIKDGSVMFIYHPTKSYLQQSQYLNG